MEGKDFFVLIIIGIISIVATEALPPVLAGGFIFGLAATNLYLYLRRRRRKG